MNGVTLFHGEKGGVGKSTACMVYADYRLRNGENPMIIDGDTCNPDVARMFQSRYKSVYNMSLRWEDEWYNLSGIAAKNPKKEIIVSLPAGAEDLDVGMLEKELAAQNLPLTVYFLMNRQRDSVKFITELFYNVSPECFIVVKNMCFARHENSFVRFDESHAAHFAKSNNVPIIALPNVNELALDRTLDFELPFHQVEHTDPRNKIRIDQWLNKAQQVLLEPMEQREAKIKAKKEVGIAGAA